MIFYKLNRTFSSTFDHLPMYLMIAKCNGILKSRFENNCQQVCLYFSIKYVRGKIGNYEYQTIRLDTLNFQPRVHNLYFLIIYNKTW